MWSQIDVSLSLSLSLYIYIYMQILHWAVWGRERTVPWSVLHFLNSINQKDLRYRVVSMFGSEVKFFFRSLEGTTIYVQCLTVDNHSSICFLSLKYATPNCTILLCIYFLGKFKFSSRPSRAFLSCSIKHNLAHSWREFVAFDVSIFYFTHTHTNSQYIYIYIYISL